MHQAYSNLMPGRGLQLRNMAIGKTRNSLSKCGAHSVTLNELVPCPDLH